LKIRHYIFLCLLAGYCQYTLAQNPYIRHYTTADGLPSNNIYQIFQDSHKFLWFTSDAGVSKFDGSGFVNYRKRDGLSSNDIVRINEDLKGRIWLFNYNSSVNYIKNDTVYNSKNAPFLKSILGKGFIVDCFYGPDKKLYFFTWQREVFSLDNDNVVRKEIILASIHSALPNLGSDISQIRIHNLSRTADNNWIIWSSTGLFKQEASRNRITIIDSSLHSKGVFSARNNIKYVLAYNEIIKVNGSFQKEHIPFPGNPHNIRTIMEDHDGHIWIAAFDEGVYCFDRNHLVKHLKIAEAQGLFEDHENNIWVSTHANGLYAISHDFQYQKHIDSYSFDGSGINKICFIPEIGLLATNKNSIFRINDNKLYQMTLPNVLQPIDLLFLLRDKTLIVGSLASYICTLRGIHADQNTGKLGFSDSSVFARPMKRIIADKTGNFLAYCQQEYLVTGPAQEASLKGKLQNFHERINNIFYNNDNVLVINSKKNYLLKNSKFEYYPLLSCFDGDVITDHLILNDSSEIFNIDGDSVFLLNNRKFYNLTASFNVPITLPIKKIVFHYPTLYLATFRDIFVCHNPFSILNHNILHINPLKISFNNINDLLVYNDSLYIASDDGLTIIAESSIAGGVSNPPIPYLKSILVNDVSSTYDAGITLTGRNKILLSFGCISYFTNSIIYSYMLVGAEKTWTTGTGSEINIVYQNLPKGKYIFRLRVRKSNSDWSKPLELPITIKPTLVEYPLFWAFTAMLLSGMIFLIIYRLRVQKMKKVEIDHQLVVMEQKALQSMMNPHFIFNSLSSVQNYLLRNKGDEAVIYLSNFSRLIRQNLNAINTPMVELTEEINRLKIYLDLEKKRLENKFDYTIETGRGLDEDDIYIPSMVVQPFAENSIWHGFSALDRKGLVQIGFYFNDSKSLKIIVEDNGIGLKKSTEYYSESSHKKHLGMQIIRKRLELLSIKYNTHTSINVTECYPDNVLPGTKVELIVPFLYEIDDDTTNTNKKKNG